MNYYDILGVPQNASFDEIRKAYRAQIKFFHPDVFRESEAVAKIKTQQLNQAYAILGDPKKRAQYDLALSREAAARRAQQAQQRPPTPPPPPPSQQAARPRKRTRVNVQKVFSTVFILIVSLSAVAALCFSLFSEPEPVTHTPGFIEQLQNSSDVNTIEYPDITSNALTPVAFRNGQIIKRPFGERVCPLEVDVLGDHAYYVYLDFIGFGGSDMSFMVSAGRSAEVLVPLGEYEIYYATGETWYGPEYKFGDDTQFYKCDDTFLFYDDGQYYRGYTLELYLQTNGNLDTDVINASAFPG